MRLQSPAPHHSMWYHFASLAAGQPNDEAAIERISKGRNRSMIHSNGRHEICQRDRYLVIKENMMKRNYRAESAILVPQMVQKERIRFTLKSERPDPDDGRSEE